MNKQRKIIIGIVVGVVVAVLLGLVLIKPFTTGMKPEEKASGESTEEAENTPAVSEPSEDTEDTESPENTTEPSESNESATETESETETTEKKEPTEPAKPPVTYSYGEDAYQYLVRIDGEFGNRVNGKTTVSLTQKERMGAFISETMRSFGYPEQIYAESHPANGTTWPMKSYTYRKAGELTKRVVIGAHYDSVETNGAEDNGTGVSLVLELAKRFANIKTRYSLEFCFWDGEEMLGEAGSYLYVNAVPDLQNVVLYVNLDCLGAGDTLYAYGGEWINGKLERAWGYNMAMKIAERQGIALHTIPDIPGDEFRAPTRLIGSDQRFFVTKGIPYVYFEGNAWVNSAGEAQYPNGQNPYQYNSNHPAIQDTAGQINHTYHDNLAHLNEVFPGRIRSHLAAFSEIITVMLTELGENSPVLYKDTVIRK